MSETAVPGRRGESASRISNRVVATFKEFIGRGPTRARTTINGNLVVCLLEDNLTKAERSLVESGKADTVEMLRREIQETMRTALAAVVEEELGQRVIAFMSANHVEPDYMAEIFVLEGEAETGDGPMLTAVP